MGKSYSKWFTRLLRRKKLPSRQQPPPPASVNPDVIEGGGSGYLAVDPNKHAIAVAAATAAVAEAALAAAKAAAEVVRMTSGWGGGGGMARGDGAAASISVSGRRKGSLEDLAAVKIQSAFRGYLARRALRALKGLVRLQALVRGHFVRKRSADMLRRMQAMFRVQARARASRVQSLDHSSSTDATQEMQGMETLGKLETQHRAGSRRLNDSSIFKRCGSVSSARDKRSIDRLNQRTYWQDNWTDLECSSHSSMRMAHHSEDDQKNDKILEIDSSWRPRSYNHNFPHFSMSHLNHQKPSYALSACDSEDVVSLRSLQFVPLESSNCMEDKSRQPYSVPSRPGSSGGSNQRRRSGRTTNEAFTPMRNELLGSRNFLIDGYSNIGYYHRNYMANTESSRAKVRSQSVPRQRPELERIGSAIDNDFRASRCNSRGNCDPCSTNLAMF